jgi:predicted permease
MTRLFRLLMWLYPPGFRRRFHREMLDLLATRAHQRPPSDLWRYALSDFFRSLPLAWHDALRPTGGRHQRPTHGPSGKRHAASADALGIVRDIAFAFRGVIRGPAFTALAVLILALGIGVNGTIFTVIHHVLLEPLPIDGADRAVYLMRHSERFDVRTSPNYAMFSAFSERAVSYDALEAYQSSEGRLTGGIEPLIVSRVATTPAFMATFGIRPTSGRALNPSDGDPDSPLVAVLDETLWRRAFGADPNIVGRTITLNDSAFTVVGIRDGDFPLPFSTSGAHVWTVLRTTPGEEDDLGVDVIARLKRGTTLTQAQAEAALIHIPESQGMDWESQVVRPQGMLSVELRTGLWVLFGAVGFVLLIACANVANMILARGIGRGQEIAVRSALGASRGRIVRLLMAESLVLCVLGGGVATLLAHWGLRVIGTLGPSGFGYRGLNHLGSVGLDGASLGFILAASLLTGLLTGLVSAFRLSRVNVGDALRVGSRYGLGGADQRLLRHTLVSVEVALALTLLLGAGLMVKSFNQLQRVDPGFDPANMGLVRIRLPEQHYPAGAQQAQFFEQLLQAVRRLPVVESAVLASGLSADVGGPLVEGNEDAGPGPLLTSVMWISPSYFDVLRTRVVRGRGFTVEDQRDATSQVAVVNEALARRFWGRDNAVGKRFRLNERQDWLTVVGVAQDVKAFGLDDDPDRMQVYYLRRPETSSANLAIRATTDFSSIIPMLKEQVALIDPNLPVRQAVAMDDELADTIVQEKFTTALFTVFAALAIVLAVAGVYAVVSVAVTLRLRELGIRLALGAESRNIMSVVLKQGMRPVALGVAVGLAASVWLHRTVEGLLFNVSGTDPVVWVASAAALILVGAAACYVPARRAMRLDPVETLRAE